MNTLPKCCQLSYLQPYTIVEVVCQRGQSKRSMDKPHLQPCDICMSDFFSDVQQNIHHQNYCIYHISGFFFLEFKRLVLVVVFSK